MAWGLPTWKAYTLSNISKAGRRRPREEMYKALQKTNTGVLVRTVLRRTPPSKYLNARNQLVSASSDIAADANIALQSTGSAGWSAEVVRHYSLDAAPGTVPENTPHVLQPGCYQLACELNGASRHHLHHEPAKVVLSFLQPTRQ